MARHDTAPFILMARKPSTLLQLVLYSARNSVRKLSTQPYVGPCVPSPHCRVQVALRFATTLAHEFALNDIRLIVYCERLHILVGGVGERYGYLGAWTRQCNGDYPFQWYTPRLFSSSLPSGLLAHGWKSDGLAGGPTPPASPGTRLPFSPFDLRCYSTDFRLQALLIVIAAVMASADRHLLTGMRFNQCAPRRRCQPQ